MSMINAREYIRSRAKSLGLSEWKDGFEEQRTKWEHDYAAAQARWEAHKVQVARMNAEAEAAPVVASDDVAASTAPADEDRAGTLADDEQLAALRAKLAGE